MRGLPFRVTTGLFVFILVLAGAVRRADAQTCVTIDEIRDTLAQDERGAARLLLSREFERAGHPIVDAGCRDTYSLSHIRLGSTIIVTLTGAARTWDGRAMGLDDLPAVYSQLVRAATTGQPMGSLAVVDRGNVSAAQDQIPRRVQSDGYFHAKLGHSTLFGAPTHSAAAFGFGYRAEFDRFGLDLSFLNLQLANTGSYRAASSSTSSLVKLEGLYFLNPAGNRSAYVGGGLSYGRTSLRDADTGDWSSPAKYGNGSGLQGELTAGYEIARVTSTRVFVQADVTLPFYNVVSETFSYPESAPGGRYLPPTVTLERNYVPSLTVSVGFGWQGRRR
jgi:hypothetical protein